MPSYKELIVRCTDQDDQCQAIAGHGDHCINKRIDGSDYCPVHGGNRALQTQRKQNIYEFNKTAFLKRAIELTSHPARYSLTEELGITRTLLETYLAKLEDETSILRYNSIITTQINLIQKLVEQALKLDQRIGELLTKERLIEITQLLVNAIAAEIEDPDVINRIIHRFNGILVDEDDNGQPARAHNQ